MSVSVSRLRVLSACEVKEHYQWILGMWDPDTQHRISGKNIHKEVETYVNTGKLPEDARAADITRHVAEFMASGKVRCEVNLTLDGVVGKADLVWFSANAVAILDIKTHKDLHWALTEEQIAHDDQLLSYAHMVLELCRTLGYTGVREVRVGQIQAQTTGAVRSRVVEADVSIEQIRTHWHESVLPRVAKAAANALRSPEDIPGNLAECDKYKGCHLRTKCHMWALKPNQEESEVINPPENKKAVSRLDALLAKSTKAPTSDKESKVLQETQLRNKAPTQEQSVHEAVIPPTSDKENKAPTQGHAMERGIPPTPDKESKVLQKTQQDTPQTLKSEAPTQEHFQLKGETISHNHLPYILKYCDVRNKEPKRDFVVAAALSRRLWELDADVQKGELGKLASLFDRIEEVCK